MKRYCLGLLVIFFCLATGGQILSLWRGRILSQQGFSKETLLQAAQADPDNPDPFRKLGFLHQWNLLQVDLKESDQYFRKAIERNPLEQEYWLDLAKVFQRTGERNGFEQALENAIHVFPTGYRGRWTAGNLLLLQGSVEEAIPHFSYILAHYPNQSSLVYDVWENVVNDPEFIFERLVPKDPSSLNQYLTYLYEAGDKESAKKVWEKRVSLGCKVDRGGTLRHIDFLISQGEIKEAFQLWKIRVQEEGQPGSYETNLITNGGFEEEKVLGDGFDWRIGSVAGAEISFDHLVVLEGKVH